MDETLNFFSSSLVKNATKAITTAARDGKEYLDEKRDSSSQEVPSLGSNWMLGCEKEMYWRPTSDSVLTRYGSDDDESIDSNDYSFPFANLESISVDPNDHNLPHPEDRISKEPTDKIPGPRTSASGSPQVVIPELTEDAAWQFFGGNISRQQAENILQ